MAENIPSLIVGSENNRSCREVSPYNDVVQLYSRLQICIHSICLINSSVDITSLMSLHSSGYRRGLQGQASKDIVWWKNCPAVGKLSRLSRKQAVFEPCKSLRLLHRRKEHGMKPSPLSPLAQMKHVASRLARANSHGLLPRSGE